MLRILSNPVLPVAIAFVFRVGLLHTWAFSVDEAYELYAVSLPFTAMLRFLAETDAHPPLFYTLLWLWTRSGIPLTEFYVRLPFALLGALTVALLYVLAASFLGKRTALLAAYLLALSPLHVRWSHEARMFSLATLVATLVAFSLLKALATGHRPYWFAYALSLAAAFYTLYTLPLLAITYVLTALLSQRQTSARLRILLFTLLAFLVFLPWASFLAVQAHDEHLSLSGPDLPGALWTIRLLVLGPLPTGAIYAKLLVYACVLFALAAGARRVAASYAGRFLLVGAVFPILAASLIVVRAEPLLRPVRLLLPVLPNAATILAAGLNSFPLSLRLPAVSMLLGTNLWSLSYSLREWPYVSDFERLTRFLLAHSRPNDYYIAYPRHVAYALHFYARRYGVDVSGNVKAYQGKSDLNLIEARVKAAEQVWVIHDNASRRTPRVYLLLSKRFCMRRDEFFGNAVLLRFSEPKCLRPRQRSCAAC